MKSTYYENDILDMLRLHSQKKTCLGTFERARMCIGTPGNKYNCMGQKENESM